MHPKSAAIEPFVAAVNDKGAADTACSMCCKPVQISAKNAPLYMQASGLNRERYSLLQSCNGYYLNKAFRGGWVDKYQIFEFLPKTFLINEQY